MKIRSVRAKMFHADGRTDRQTDRHDETNTVVPFCYFANVPKNRIV
jgi:hypothetical protein